MSTSAKPFHKILPAVVIVACLAMLSATHVAYAISSGTQLVDPNPQTLGQFGFTVSISGSAAVVGAWFETVGTLTGAGRAYVFDASNGDLITTLTSPSPQHLGEFGTSVAIDGSTAVVGAPDETDGTFADAGHAYVFNATTGELIATLTSPNSQADGGFGTSVAISDTTVIVGAPYEISGTTADSGRAYVFDATTGDLITSLASPNAQPSGEFGLSVGVFVDDATAIVGAPNEMVGTTIEAGQAYVFDATTGDLLNSLASPNAEVGGGFGKSVAISGTTVVAGSPYETVGTAVHAGRAYVFDATTAALISTLTSLSPQTNAEFGDSVSIGVAGVAVGAPSETEGTTLQAGHAYLFDATTGGLINAYVSASPQSVGRFGWSVGVATDDSTLVVGAYYENEGTAVKAGHAYVFL
jgi:hypothetical protein